MSDTERTFRYFDGAAEVHGDPRALRRCLIAATEGKFNALLRDYYGTDELAQAQAATVVLVAVRQVFRMVPFDRATGQGATDDDCDRVLCDFQNYLSALKKKLVTSPSTAPSTEPASSTSLPKSNSASLSIVG